MRLLGARTLTLSLGLLLSGWAAPAVAARQQSEEPLTNASVIKLVRAGFADKTVISIIGSRPVRFDLSPDQLIELKKRRVSEKVILAMIARANGDALAAADWGDDAFFDDAPLGGGSRQGRGAPQAGGSDPGEVNIFGSSGGSSGRTRTRGGGASGENDTQTLGSASVRLLRPPAEAGGAGAPKLERTPTLTNQSIIDLVEAGFSEGTIVRRIEQSPADFDLSPKRLEELKRKRVTERVIQAMRAAMSEDAPAPGSGADRP